MKKTVLSLVLSALITGCASTTQEPMVESFTPTASAAQIDVDSAYRPPAAEAKPVVLTKFDTLSESKSYLEVMRALVSNGNIAAALQMRQEARQLHDNLQQQFVTLYGKPAESIKVSADMPEDLTAEKRLVHVYQQQMNVNFREGNTQAALALIDQVEKLVMHAGDVLGS